MATIEAYKWWVESGKPVNPKTNKPNLNKSDVIFIVKLLLQTFGPTEKAYSFNSDVKAISRLFQINSDTETTWEQEMEKLVYNSTKYYYKHNRKSM